MEGQTGAGMMLSSVCLDKAEAAVSHLRTDVGCVLGSHILPFNGSGTKGFGIVPNFLPVALPLATSGLVLARTAPAALAFVPILIVLGFLCYCSPA